MRPALRTVQRNVVSAELQYWTDVGETGGGACEIDLACVPPRIVSDLYMDLDIPEDPARQIVRLADSEILTYSFDILLFVNGKNARV